MNNLFNINVKLDELTEGQHVHAGVLQVTPNEHIEVEQIQGKLLQKVKGKMASQNALVDNFTLSTQYQQLQPNETYEFPFKVIQPSSVGTYKGKNVHIFYELEFAVELEKESFKRLDKGVFKSIKSFVSGNTDYKYSKSIILRKAINYNLFEDSESLQLSGGGFIIIVVFSMLFIALWLILFSALNLDKLESMSYLLGGGIVASVILGYLSKFAFFRSILGTFNVDISQENEEEFKSVVHSTSNWKYASEVNTYYEIIEEVTDDRGTSSYTYTEAIYHSPPIAISKATESEETTHRFPPQNNMPPSININNVSLKWVFIMEVKTILNLNLKYKKNIYHQSD